MKIYQLVIADLNYSIHDRKHFTSKKSAKAALADERREYAEGNSDRDPSNPVRFWIEELEYPISAKGMIEAMNHVARYMEVDW